MVYRAIGLMSGSSLDGLDIVFAEFTETSGSWSYEIRETGCIAYDEHWKTALKNAIHLPASEYLALHTAYGHYLGEQVNRFIGQHQLQYQVQLIASHGHTTFHVPAQRLTAQLGDGAAIAAATGINVVSDLRAMDMALGGQGAPIVPIGEKRLLAAYPLFLNIGGIANLSVNRPGNYLAFDICPANRVLNMLAADAGALMDEDGKMAAGGALNQPLLEILNNLDYYALPLPKSLSNDFGTDVVYPLIRNSGCGIPAGLRTCTEHIAIQVSQAIRASAGDTLVAGSQLLVTGGGAHNRFLVERLQALLEPLGIGVVVPDSRLVDYKEALIMALIGILRWREENNVLASVTGAGRDSIGGAVWMGQEA